MGGSAIGAAFLAPDDRPPSQASERSEPRRSTGDPVAAAAAASAAAAAASAAASAAAVASAVVAEDEGPTGGAAAAAARAGGGDAFLKRLVTAAGEPIVASTLAFVDTFEPAAAAAGEQAAVDASVHPDALAARASSRASRRRRSRRGPSPSLTRWRRCARDWSGTCMGLLASCRVT